MMQVNAYVADTHALYWYLTAGPRLGANALAAIPEMHDRIIASVAYDLKIPCLTRDPAIVNSGVIQAVW